MPGFRSLLGDDSNEQFADEQTFDQEHIPTPGSFLDGHDVLTGTRHIQFHQLTAEVFEERGVYDMTFGYNLAKLNRDTRHPEAGYRYAVQADDPSVLRAEFTPTTEFCPQSDTLTKGSFRAWNALRDRHDYDCIRVRVAETHQQSEAVNESLAEMETQFEREGEIPAVEDGSGTVPDGGERGPTAPF